MAAPPVPVEAQQQPPPPEPDEPDEPAGMAAEPPASFAEQVPLGTTASPAGGARVRGHPVAVPDLPGLARREDILRALRPLRKHGPSPRRQVVDEDATATFIANTGLWTPVTRPAPERWFDLVLAIDSSPSMELWRPLIRDLHILLAGTGAFRDIRTWQLRPERHTTIPSGPAGVARSHRELIGGAGRRLFLVVTDGAAHGWHDGSAASVLADWGKTGPVAILQPLPEMMWTRTGLPAVPVRLSANKPGTPNRRLRVAYYRRRRTDGIPVPVLAIEPNALHSWARLVRGAVSGVPLAATTAGGRRPPASLVGETEPGSPVDVFRASASPQAYQLAVLLSAVPLTLPVMRLVQHFAVPAADTSALAEVILGGLVSRTGDGTYEFLPGVREDLLGELRRSEMTRMLLVVSDFIAQHAGTATQTFAATAHGAEGPAAADAAAFSWVPAAVAVRLGMPHIRRQDPGAQSKFSDDTPAYSISLAAQLCDMQPPTLRRYERAGLVSPARSRTGTRRYSMRDILKLREIHQLADEEGVALSGIKRILDLERELEQVSLLTAELHAEASQLRAQLEFTREVAARLAQLRRTGSSEALGPGRAASSDRATRAAGL
jgi:DNA-binding transcriptional MerR regulator